MKKINEKDIEQYIRFPQELSAEEIAEIVYAIESSDETRIIYEFLREYYLNLDRIELSKTYTFSLRAVHLRQANSGPVVLAAMTTEKPIQKLKTRATLVSEEHNTLIRVLENIDTNLLQFHILSQQYNSERAILSIMNPEIDLVSDKNGKVRNVENLSDIQWETISTILRLPVYKIKIDLNARVPNLLQNVLDSNIEISYADEKLKLRVLNSSKLTRVLSIQGQEVLLNYFDNQIAEIECYGDKSVTLYFYE